MKRKSRVYLGSQVKKVSKKRKWSIVSNSGKSSKIKDQKLLTGQEKVLFFNFWLGKIIACSYANEKNPVKREKMMIIGEWGKTSLEPCL